MIRLVTACPPRRSSRERGARSARSTRRRRRRRTGFPTRATVDVDTEKKESRSDEILDKLDKELIGLKPVKQRIREVADLLVVDRLRQKFGIESTRPTLHMSFTGSPGTGKTTVAWRMAELLDLAKGHLVDVTRDDWSASTSATPPPRPKLKRAMGLLPVPPGE